MWTIDVCIENVVKMFVEISVCLLLESMTGLVTWAFLWTLGCFRRFEFNYSTVYSPYYAFFVKEPVSVVEIKWWWTLAEFCILAADVLLDPNYKAKPSNTQKDFCLNIIK